MVNVTNNLRIRATHPLISPLILEEALPLSETTANVVASSRQKIVRILKGEDKRLLVIMGPCSIHDTKAGLEYAQRLQQQVSRYQNELFLVLRVYFEKPRTTIGWKGLLNDPDLDGSFHINKGLHLARKFLIDTAELGLPAATEFLDTTFGQYYTDLISLGAIGARTTESQVHRELASGLSMPVGFKNRTDGDIQIAVDAMVTGREWHSFPSLTKEGSPAIMETSANPDCSLILRGGSLSGPNYRQDDIEKTTRMMQKENLNPAIVIDCSHGNSNKDFVKQTQVVEDICQQIVKNNTHSSFRGVMIEGHLKSGRQKALPGQALVYGQSITDGCLDWDDSLILLEKLANAVQSREKNRA